MLQYISVSRIGFAYVSTVGCGYVSRVKCDIKAKNLPYAIYTLWGEREPRTKKKTSDSTLNRWWYTRVQMQYLYRGGVATSVSGSDGVCGKRMINAMSEEKNARDFLGVETFNVPRYGKKQTKG